MFVSLKNGHLSLQPFRYNFANVIAASSALAMLVNYGVGSERAITFNVMSRLSPEQQREMFVSKSFLSESIAFVVYLLPFLLAAASLLHLDDRISSCVAARRSMGSTTSRDGSGRAWRRRHNRRQVEERKLKRKAELCSDLASIGRRLERHKSTQSSSGDSQGNTCAEFQASATQLLASLEGAEGVAAWQHLSRATTAAVRLSQDRFPMELSHTTRRARDRRQRIAKGRLSFDFAQRDILWEVSHLLVGSPERTSDRAAVSPAVGQCTTSPSCVTVRRRGGSKAHKLLGSTAGPDLATVFHCRCAIVAMLLPGSNFGHTQLTKSSLETYVTGGGTKVPNPAASVLPGGGVSSEEKTRGQEVVTVNGSHASAPVAKGLPGGHGGIVRKERCLEISV